MFYKMVSDEVTQLLLEYRNIINKLRKLGIIRNSKVVGEIGEYIICKKLNLSQNESSGKKGYDATDDEGKKYEIKTRKATAWNKPTKINVKKPQLKSADFLIYAELDDSWNLVKILKIPIKEINQNNKTSISINKDLNQKYSIL